MIAREWWLLAIPVGVVIGAAISSPANGQEPIEPSYCAQAAVHLGIELAAAKQELAKTRLQLTLAQSQTDALNRTLSAVMQAQAGQADEAAQQDQEAIGARLLNLLGGNPATEMFDFTSKTVQPKKKAER